jgi:hypothetical protein
MKTLSATALALFLAGAAHANDFAPAMQAFLEGEIMA